MYSILHLLLTKPHDDKGTQRIILISYKVIALLTHSIHWTKQIFLLAWQLSLSSPQRPKSTRGLQHLPWSPEAGWLQLVLVQMGAIFSIWPLPSILLLPTLFPSPSLIMFSPSNLSSSDHPTLPSWNTGRSSWKDKIQLFHFTRGKTRDQKGWFTCPRSRSDRIQMRTQVSILPLSINVGLTCIIVTTSRYHPCYSWLLVHLNTFIFKVNVIALPWEKN